MDVKFIFQLSKLGSIPPLEEMTLEMYTQYFPEKVPNPDKPTFFPHDKASQPGVGPEIKP